VDGLSHGLQTGSKGPAFESSEKRAIVLIPNIVKLAGPGPVDALLHLHGFGTGYRELKPGKHDHAGILQRAVARRRSVPNAAEICSPTPNHKRLVVGVLPQGSETTGFGNVGSQSDAYLTEVFGKLIPGR